jgi:hypothetical protein
MDKFSITTNAKKGFIMTAWAVALMVATSISSADAQTTKRKNTQTRPTARRSTPARKTPPARAQAVKPAKSSSTTAPVSTPSAAPAPQPTPPPQFLQIRYFGEYLGSNLYRWDDTLTDVTTNGNYKPSTDPLQMFHQIGFRFRLSEEVRLWVEPRFITQFGSRAKMGADEDQQVIQQFDFRVRLGTNYWTSEDKQWSTTFLGGTRIPTDRGSKNANIVLQPEVLHITNFTPNPTWSFGLWNQVRYYWYESDVDSQRWRLYTGPSFTYTIDDIWSVFVMYEHEMNHRSNPGARRNFVHMKETLQDVYAGVNYNINPSLTIYPFIRFAQVSTWDPQTQQVGFWLMGAIY